MVKFTKPDASSIHRKEDKGSWHIPPLHLTVHSWARDETPPAFGQSHSEHRHVLTQKPSQNLLSQTGGDSSGVLQIAPQHGALTGILASINWQSFGPGTGCHEDLLAWRGIIPLPALLRDLHRLPAFAEAHPTPAWFELQGDPRTQHHWERCDPVWEPQLGVTQYCRVVGALFKFVGGLSPSL